MPVSIEKEFELLWLGNRLNMMLLRNGLCPQEIIAVTRVIQEINDTACRRQAAAAPIELKDSEIVEMDKRLRGIIQDVLRDDYCARIPVVPGKPC